MTFLWKKNLPKSAYWIAVIFAVKTQKLSAARVRSVVANHVTIATGGTSDKLSKMSRFFVNRDHWSVELQHAWQCRHSCATVEVDLSKDVVDGRLRRLETHRLEHFEHLFDCDETIAIHVKHAEHRTQLCITYSTTISISLLLPLQ